MAADSEARGVMVGRVGVTRWSRLTGLAVLGGLAVSACSQPEIAVDLLVKGGEVYSGDLEAPKIQDVGVVGDRIVFIGDADAAGVTAAKTIDATGKMVAPGFIDAHSHAPAEFISDDPKKRLTWRLLTQGVTTNIINVDGGVSGTGSHLLKPFIAKVEAAGVGTNFASFVGFLPIRQAVLGNDARAPSAEELATMKTMAAEAMCEGQLGLSSGLFYAPQSFATTEEVIEVAKEAGQRGGLYDTHQRDEGNTTIGIAASLTEAIRIGRESGATLHVGHFKVSSGARPNGESMKALVAMIEAARAAGQPITSDQYPWSASNTGLVAMAIPRWAQDGGREAMLKRFDNPADLARIEAASAEFFQGRGGAQNVMISRAAGQPELVGKRMSAVAESWGVTPAQAAVRILRQGDAAVILFSITEPDIEHLLKQPWNMISSDGSDGSHPRGYATYPRLYAEYVLKGVITPTEFVHKSSGLVADSMGLTGRGYIRPDHVADIVVIDLKTYRPMATFTEPQILSQGVTEVVVNGRLAMEDGQPTGVLAGRGILKPPPAGTCP
jgi:N-acyl-D-amino-acid deacylase